MKANENAKWRAKHNHVTLTFDSIDSKGRFCFIVDGPEKNSVEDFKDYMHDFESLECKFPRKKDNYERSKMQCL